MNDTKHTPGPWKRSGCLIYALNDLNFNRFSARFDSSRQPGEADAYECEANATLAAAAPELLEALNRCEAALSAYLIECGPLMTPIDAEEICTTARAAIEKARGGR